MPVNGILPDFTLGHLFFILPDFTLRLPKYPFLSLENVDLLLENVDSPLQNVDSPHSCRMNTH